MIKVDLRSKAIGPDHNVFLVRPGSNYKLYNTFLESSAIFADFLGLELDEGVELKDQDRITAQLHRAKKLRALRHTADGPPSRNLDDYADFKDDRSVSQLYGILRGFFEVAKAGDLVVIPPSSFSQNALIGELVSGPTEMVTTLYKGERLYGRSVRWLRQVPRGKLSPYLLDLISKPNAFVLVRNDERPSIYREAYGSYIMPGEYRARFNVDDPEFTTSDDLYIQAFFNLVVANSKRIREGNPVLGIRDAAFERVVGSDAMELQSNINSPGYLNLIGKSLAPLVASALFVLAVTVGPGAVAAAEQGTILIGNSKDAGDACTVAVHKEVLDHLRLLGVAKWTDACQIAKQAADSTGLSGQAQIVIDSYQQKTGN